MEIRKFLFNLSCPVHHIFSLLHHFPFNAMLSLIIYVINAGYTTPRLYGKSRYTCSFDGVMLIAILIVSHTEWWFAL